MDSIKLSYKQFQPNVSQLGITFTIIIVGIFGSLTLGMYWNENKILEPVDYAPISTEQGIKYQLISENQYTKESNCKGCVSLASSYFEYNSISQLKTIMKVANNLLDSPWFIYYNDIYSNEAIEVRWEVVP